jgi:hypothetical protein
MDLHQIDSIHEESSNKASGRETAAEKISSKVTFKLQPDQNDEIEEDISIFFKCNCCNNTYCLRCCKLHLKIMEGLLDKR